MGKKSIVYFCFIPLFIFSQEKEITKNELLGIVNPSQNKEEWVKIDSSYAYKKNLYLRKEAYLAFLRMAEAAKKENIRLVILSAFRSFEDQKHIWEAKWQGKRKLQNKNINDFSNKEEKALLILKYSAMPGSSRHHWGTDIDLNSLENSYFEKGEGKRIYEWLKHNAPKYGFCQPYTAKNQERKTGYEEEKWHWSYYPLSRLFLKHYQEKITYSDIQGFQGAEFAQSLNLFENYVNGIDKNCQ